MLSLESPKWLELSHAYGSASDIPELLQSLAVSPAPKNDYQGEPWFSLWSCLCHQGDVYDASYAAVPHIVDIGCNADGPINFGIFQLPAAIEIARRNGNGPLVPADLVAAYEEALSLLNECVAIHRKEKWDQDMLISAMCAQAVAKGHIKIAEALMNFDEDLIEKCIKLDFGD